MTAHEWRPGERKEGARGETMGSPTWNQWVEEGV